MFFLFLKYFTNKWYHSTYILRVFIEETIQKTEKFIGEAEAFLLK
jgi:hypothetical protein